MEAKIETPTSEPVPVLIRNYSAGGLFLQINPHYNGAQTDQLVQNGRVIITLKLPKASQAERYFGKIAHRSREGLGVSFQQQQTELQTRLANVFSQRSNANGKHVISDPDPLLLATVSDLCRQWADKNFQAFLPIAEESLLNHADLAKNANDQNQFFAAMGFLRRHHKNAVDLFVQSLEHQIKTFDSIESEQKDFGADSDLDELSLVDEQEFEIWLAQSEAISSVESKAYAGLRALEARLTVIHGEDVDNKNNPLGPMVLSHCALKALRQQNFPLSCLLVLIKEFGLYMQNKLPELVKQANDTLIKAGVLPKFSKIKRQPRANSEPDSMSPEQQADPSELPAAEFNQQTEPMQEPPQPPSSWSDTNYHSPASSIVDLQKYLKPRTSPVDSDRASPVDPEHDDQLAFDLLNQALTELSQRIDDPLENMRLSQQIQDIFDNQPDSNHNILNGPQADAVFVTDQLFNAMLDDEVINESSKQLISELEIPLLRSLLKDDSVLTQSTHPARRLINMLGNASVEPDDQQDSSLSSQIKDILQELKNINNPNEQDFQTALEKIESLLKRQERAATTHTKRVVEASEGQFKLRKAEKTVNQELNQRLTGNEIPQVVVDLLKSGWQELLKLAALRHGTDGDDWSKKLSIIEQLTKTPEILSEINTDEFINQIENDLAQAGASPAQLRTIKHDIEELLSGAKVNKTQWQPAATEDAAAETEWPDPDQAERFTEEQMDRSFWLGQTKLIEIGQWLIERESTGQVRPMKLAWVSEDHSRYAFVDRNGQKALELDANELAQRLKYNQAGLVEQSNHSLIERSQQNAVKQMHDQIAHQATHDELTGTLNRKEFERILRQKLGESKLVHSTHAAMQLDLDQFRVINSSAGHEAGDQLLIELARSIQEELPENAKLSRLGGDLFTVIISRCSGPESHELAERIRRKIANHRTEWKSRKLRATASFGLVLIDRDTESVSQILNQLDSACASAKESGDRIRSYELDDAELSRRDQVLTWVSELEKALDADRLVLYAQKMQPLHPDNQGEEHFEVLCRIKQLDGTMILPDKFVPAAEAHGRIHFLDEAVFRAAFKMLSECSPENSNIRLSLNLSGKTFSRPNFLSFVKQLLNEYSVAPSRICFEITETAAIANLSRCADVLKELRYLGCQFSLDDFGTGLSSFGYLKNLPVDYLKIDGSFVKDIVHSHSDRGLVKTMNEIGQMLGKKTVAECVESEQALEYIKELGLDYAQGFQIARPIPLSDVLGIS